PQEQLWENTGGFRTENWGCDAMRATKAWMSSELCVGEETRTNSVSQPSILLDLGVRKPVRLTRLYRAARARDKNTRAVKNLHSNPNGGERSAFRALKKVAPPGARSRSAAESGRSCNAI